MKRYYCAVNAWNCPYWKKGGICSMGDEGLDPIEECDDFATFWGPDDKYWEDVE